MGSWQRGQKLLSEKGEVASGPNCVQQYTALSLALITNFVGKLIHLEFENDSVLDAVSLGWVAMNDKRKFGKVLLSFRQQRLIHSDNFYKEPDEEIRNLKEPLLEIKSLDICEENRLSLENVKRLILRNFSINPLA
ncbi:UNVERIFIED_CONTAM: hypothetical protein Sindi_0363600 [Sesamum indicum]